MSTALDKPQIPQNACICIGNNCVVVVTKARIDSLMEDAVCCSMTDITEIQRNDSDATLDNAEMI